MLQADVKMREWGEQPEEDPFVRYLSGIIYEQLGEYDDAVIAYRQAMQVYRETKDRQPTGVPQQLALDLMALLKRQGRDDELRQLSRDTGLKPPVRDPRKGQVVVIVGNGTAPERSEQAIQTFATEIEDVVRIALPRYAAPKHALHTIVAGAAGMQQTLQTVEDVDALARNALDEDMAGITARAIARAVVKHHTEKKAKDKDPFAGLLTKIANLATERADTRSWTTLPEEILLARLELPPGEQQLDIAVRNGAGNAVDHIVRNVNVRAGRLVVVSAHWVAPVVGDTGKLTAAN
jgi:hypothetical protein